VGRGEWVSYRFERSFSAQIYKEWMVQGGLRRGGYKGTNSIAELFQHESGGRYSSRVEEN